MDISKKTAKRMQRFGAQIRALRIAAGLDQQGVADVASVSISSVRALETGGGSSLVTIVKVLRALEAADWLETLMTDPVALTRQRVTLRS